MVILAKSKPFLNSSPQFFKGKNENDNKTSAWVFLMPSET